MTAAARRPRSRTRRLAGAGLLVSLVLAACSAGTSPTDAPAPDGAATCTHLAELTTSMAALDAVDLTSAGSDTLQPAIQAVSTATSQLISTADPSIAQDLEALEGSVNILEAAYQEASAGSIPESAASIGTAIDGVQAAAAVVETQLKPSCP